MIRSTANVLVSLPFFALGAGLIAFPCGHDDSVFFGIGFLCLGAWALRVDLWNEGDPIL
jgi:hypothetical protein